MLENLLKELNANYETLVNEGKIKRIDEAYGYKLACDFVEAKLNNLLKPDVIGSVCFNCNEPTEYHTNGLAKYRCECGAVNRQTVL